MFTFELDTEALFEERARQFVNAWGIPARIVADARARIRDPWSDRPGGWTSEWAVEAEKAEAQGDWLLAALCWGAAKFPTIATPSRAEAYRRQLLAYQALVPGLPVEFKRRSLSVDGPAGPTSLVAHAFRRRHLQRPGTIFISGGVDTWKIELHRPAMRMARVTGFTVVALDNPGTGETEAPISPTADRIVAETIRALAPTDSGPTGMIGVSFAGLWAAKLGIDGHVDAAITLGGPVGAQEVPDLHALPNGMPGILAHACGLTHIPAAEQTDELQHALSLRRQGYFDRAPESPVLAVNGEHDHFISRADTTVFASLPSCEAWLIRNSTHCAAEKISTVMPAALMWMIARMTNQRRDRIKAAVLKPLAVPALTDVAGDRANHSHPARPNSQSTIRRLL